MTEEEKKTMYYFSNEYTFMEDTLSVKLNILLNLVEKQQKALKNSVSKEAIREKIKEILKYKEIAENEIEEKIIIADSDSLNFGRKQAHGKDGEILKEILGE